MVSSNMNWVDTAELKAVKIDKSYGKKETYTSIILMGVVIYLVLMILSFFVVINYGESIIYFLKSFVNRGNFFNIAFFLLSFVTLFVFLAQVMFSVKGISKTRVGINHQVNTKDNYVVSIVSLVVTSAYILILLGLVIYKIISLNM